MGVSVSEKGRAVCTFCPGHTREAGAGVGGTESWLGDQ